MIYFSYIRNARKFKNYPSTLFENPKSLEKSSVLTGTELFSAHQYMVLHFVLS